jgi:putative RecB family exonuclease
VALPLPSSLSPSKVSSFQDCALAFRLSNIDKVPEPPSPAASRGTLVHRALQLLFWDEEPGQRTLPVALEKLSRAEAELAGHEEFAGLQLTEAEALAFHDEAEQFLRRYFELEDPNAVRVIGVELLLEARLGSLLLRGIIDRLELDDDGELVVTDYKTGRSPGPDYELPRMAGVHFYAFLCEQALGRRPARIQLLHLDEPVAISLVPSEQSLRGLRRRAEAIWAAVEQACADDDFRPSPGRACDWCGYKAYCPAWGGDLSAVPVRTGTPRLEAVAPS